MEGWPALVSSKKTMYNVVVLVATYLWIGCFNRNLTTNNIMRHIKLSLTTLFLLLVLAMVGPAQAQTSYVIQRGDTLYSIALQFGTSVDALAAANNIINPNLIFAGQSLIIPGDDTGGDSGSPAPPTPPPAPPAQPVPPAQPPPWPKRQ